MSWFRPERQGERRVSSWLLLFGLGVAWAVVLVPDLVRRNVSSRRNDTIGQFARGLSTLERTRPVGGHRSHAGSFGSAPFGRSSNQVIDLRGATPVVTARTPVLQGNRRRTPTQQRRVDILSGLVTAALLTFLASVSLGGIATTLNLVVDVLLVAYIGALLSVTRRERTRAHTGVAFPSQLVVPSRVVHQRAGR